MLILDETFEKECVDLLMQKRPGQLPVVTAYNLVDMGSSCSAPDLLVLDMFKWSTTVLPEEKGIAFLGKDDRFLYVFGCFEDSDVYNSATGENERTWETGDVMEFFFQAPGKEEYYELHLTPGNSTLELRIPKLGKIGLVPFESLFFDSGFFTHAEKFEHFDCKGWMGLMEIPLEKLGITDGNFQNSRFAVGRYNYNCKWDAPEISSTAIFPEGGFHQPHLWQEIKR